VCRVCGEKLTKESRYRTKYGKNLGLICKKCRNKQKKRDYKTIPKKFALYMRRGAHKYRIEFDSFGAKHDFITTRRLQQRGGRSRASPSSRYTQIVWEDAEFYDDEGHKIRISSPMACAECGGVVRYGDTGYKICDDCGLVQNLDFNIIETDLNYKANRLRREPHRWSVPKIDPAFKNDADGSTTDIYYSRAYRRRKRT